MYFRGLGVPKDGVQALAWFRKAAEQGYAEAQDALGNLYAIGQDVPKDYVQSVAWYRKAAEQGYPPAQSTLGLSYYRGVGVPKDDVQALAWFILAAAGKPEELFRDGLRKKLSPAQVTEAVRLSSEWKPGQSIPPAH